MKVQVKCPHCNKDLVVVVESLKPEEIRNPQFSVASVRHNQGPNQQAYSMTDYEDRPDKI